MQILAPTYNLLNKNRYKEDNIKQEIDLPYNKKDIDV